MAWSTPSFEELKMDAEARGYAGWVDSPEPGPDGEALASSSPAAGSASVAEDDGSAGG